MAGTAPEIELEFMQARRAAVARVSGEPAQEKCLEHAVFAGHQSRRNEGLRKNLAKYLQVHHERAQAVESR